MEWTFFALGALGSFSFGYMYGKVRGYVAAQPTRDERGKFIKRK